MLNTRLANGLTGAFTAERHLAPVKVSKDRVIREVVGLRPYRASGFVVEAERFGNKLLVHNYGHGGGGVTLSWGTASLAVDLARDFVATNRRRRRFAVLGCGVSGLSTARLLQRRFQNGPGTVTIYAKDLPPDTTSNVAGAWWSPTSVYEESSREIQRTIPPRVSNLKSSVSTARWTRIWRALDRLRLSSRATRCRLQRELPGGNDLYPAQQIHRDPERYFGFPFVRQYSTMLIEPSIYLSALLRDFYIAGGRVVVKEFRNRREIARLPEPVVFNCTGLGARDLFDDQELEPVRGQIEVLLPQPEVDYAYLSSGYMFPRRDGIVLGGTWDHGDWSLAPNPEQANHILESHIEIMKNAKSV